MISRDGRLFPKLLLVMQEPSGDLGSVVEKRVKDLEKRYKNIEVFASKSGKLTSDLVERWYYGTLFDAIKAKQEAKMLDDDDTAVLTRGQVTQNTRNVMN